MPPANVAKALAPVTQDLEGVELGPELELDFGQVWARLTTHVPMWIRALLCPCGMPAQNKTYTHTLSLSHTHTFTHSLTHTHTPSMTLSNGKYGL